MQLFHRPSFPPLRLILVCFAALAVSFPIAIISISKLLVFLYAMGSLVAGWVVQNKRQKEVENYSTIPILVAIAAIGASGLWSSGTTPEVLAAVSKHAKLVLIPVILYLLRSRREAMIAMVFFAIGQIFLLLSTWLLASGINVPWSKNTADSVQLAIFSSYLDQSIMTAVFAAFCWHLRVLLPARLRPTAIIASLMAMVCVFFFFQGRTGHVIALAMIALACFFEAPKRYRIGALLLPLIILLGLFAGSEKVRQGLTEAANGIGVFSQGTISTSSAAIRINFWHRSIQAMGEYPWLGSGAGSWSHEFNLKEAASAQPNFVKNRGNPHQEFLLWGVELGILGIALLCGIFSALYRDSLLLAQAPRRTAQSLLLALILACLFNTALFDALIGDFFWAAFGLILALGRYLGLAPGQPRAAIAQPLSREQSRLP